MQYSACVVASSATAGHQIQMFFVQKYLVLLPAFCFLEKCYFFKMGFFTISQYHRFGINIRFCMFWMNLGDLEASIVNLSFCTYCIPKLLHKIDLMKV